jgi:hypothetical protein
MNIEFGNNTTRKYYDAIPVTGREGQYDFVASRLPQFLDRFTDGVENPVIAGRFLVLIPVTGRADLTIVELLEETIKQTPWP